MELLTPAKAAAVTDPVCVPLAIVGAGPHALTLVLRLLADDTATDAVNEGERRLSSRWARRIGVPAASRKLSAAARLASMERRPRITVVDPSGSWLTSWTALFDALEISHLRSPSFISPDPFDGEALRAFALRNVDDFPASAHFAPPPPALFASTRSHATVATMGLGRAARSVIGINQVAATTHERPSAALFAACCRELVTASGVAGWVRPHSVTRIVPGVEREGGGGAKSFCLHLSNGETVHAARVVIATGSHGRPRVPTWVYEAAARLRRGGGSGGLIGDDDAPAAAAASEVVPTTPLHRATLEAAPLPALLTCA